MSAEQDSSLSQFGQARRWLLKAGLIAGAVSTVSLIARNFDLVPATERKKQNLGIPGTLTGIIPNCHHLPYVEDQDTQEKLIGNIEMTDPVCTRVFLVQFEPRLGEYQQAPIDKVAKLAKRMPITVDLFDAYPALHAPEPSSSYLVPKLGRDIREKQMAIFMDPEIRQALARRLKVAVQALKGEAGIKAWGVANELNLRINNIAWMRDLHTDLFQELIEAILSVDSSRPIFIGIDDPNLIIEERFTHYRTPIINTIHVYPWPSHLKMVYDYRSKEEHFLPLVCQEIGYRGAHRENGGSVIVTPEYDRALSQFSIQIFNGLSSVESLIIHAWGPWRISADGDTHNDGFEIIPDKMPETLATLELIGESLVRNV